MHYIIWALRLIVFVLVVLFAIKNIDPVTVNFWGRWSVTEIPLIVVILTSFVLGAFYMYLLNLPTRFTRNREIKRLQGEVNHLQEDLQHAQQKVAAPVTVEPTAVTAPDSFIANK